MTTIDQKKAEILQSQRDSRVHTLAYQDVELDKRMKEVEDAWKKLTRGALEVKQRIAELDKMEVIEAEDVNSVVAQISKLRSILLPGSGNTGALSQLIVGGSINAEHIIPGSIAASKLRV